MGTHTEAGCVWTVFKACDNTSTPAKIKDVDVTAALLTFKKNRKHYFIMQLFNCIANSDVTEKKVQLIERN